MDLSRVDHGTEDQKRLPFPELCHTYLTNDKTWHSYTLPMEDKIIYKSSEKLLGF